ncbi:MAG: MBL fold metallo-hydrolase [Phycisphaerae bacterium]|nr:MBL fold metallo-hydrolase [Phycisphaerae bacterium]
MIRAGRFQVYSVINGHIWLDGGAMFGVVPKVLWQKQAVPDKLNRIQLAMRTLVAIDDDARRVILVDSGAGSKWAPKDARRYGISHCNALAELLSSLGLTDMEVTDVVITHLHFDHAGGMTFWKNEPGGEIEVRFPNARHWVHARHLEHARNPTLRDKASFMPRDYEELDKRGLLQYVTGDEPAGPFEGMRWLLSKGHTPYQLLPWFEDDERPLLFAGDMIPQIPHLSPTWGMGYDLYPVTTLEEKRRVLRMCVENHLRLAFSHDPEVGGAEVEMVAGRPVVSRVLDL